MQNRARSRRKLTLCPLGNRFFDINFREGAYGSKDATFNFALEVNYSISGEAIVNVPTTIMAIFGNDNVPIRVGCEAMLDFSATDVMFVKMVYDYQPLMSDYFVGTPEIKTIASS